MSRAQRDVTGVLFLDKPIGMSSQSAVSRVKRIFSAKKAGHTGCLDPLASGCLPICLGEATKYSDYLLTADKVYQVGVQLGVRTSTGDQEGAVLADRPVKPLSLEALQDLWQPYIGTQQQVPPLYSALKVNGRPLYHYARRGIDVERAARTITVYSIKLLRCDMEQRQFDIEVSVSKGTYIRSLVDDFGEQLGCGAHVLRLRRLSVGTYTHALAELAMLSELSADCICDEQLLPIDSLLPFPALTVPADLAARLQMGQQVVYRASHIVGDVVRVYHAQRFIGLCEYHTAQVLIPKRLMSS